eukprot:m.214853 g.214853  ORF g.214853 m.214853 type:complete len:232 (-) comp10772_c0_seq9:6792-7487(-)
MLKPPMAPGDLPSPLLRDITRALVMICSASGNAEEIARNGQRILQPWTELFFGLVQQPNFVQQAQEHAVLVQLEFLLEMAEGFLGAADRLNVRSLVAQFQAFADFLPQLFQLYAGQDKMCTLILRVCRKAVEYLANMAPAEAQGIIFGAVMNTINEFAIHTQSSKSKADELSTEERNDAFLIIMQTLMFASEYGGDLFILTSNRLLLTELHVFLWDLPRRPLSSSFVSGTS